MILIPLKAGHHGPASEMPLNGVLLVCLLWPNIECWLGSFTILRESRPVLLKNLIFCDFPGGPDPLSPTLNPQHGGIHVHVQCGFIICLS